MNAEDALREVARAARALCYQPTIVRGIAPTVVLKNVLSENVGPQLLNELIDAIKALDTSETAATPCAEVLRLSAEIARLRTALTKACQIAHDLNGDNGDSEELVRRRDQINGLMKIAEGQ